MPDRSYLSIGEVLSLLQPEFPDLTISKIRFLESQGLLDPERTPSGYRKFYDADVERLRWILRQQREQYLPLKVIKGKLSGDEDDEDDDAGSPQPVDEWEGLEQQRPAPAATAPPPPPPPAVTPRRTAGDDGAAAPRPAAAADLGDNPLAVARVGASLTRAELARASGLSEAELADLERFGLISGRPVGDSAWYDEEALIVANLAAGFMRFGVEARHLRMYKTAAEREAGFFEQLVLPLLRQRNPRARREAVETLAELGRLGQSLRAAMLRLALRDHLG